jgi:GT2 family glycosyltransferase
VVANPTNRGFAGGCNQGIAAAVHEHVLLLNPDAVLRTPVTPLVESGAGCSAGRLEDALGKPQAGFTVRRFPTPATLAFEALGLNRLWPSNPVNRRYRCADLDLDRAQEVEQPAGALLMVRRDVWRDLGGFDERFHPVWFEDVDFLLRAKRAGHRVWYDPAVRATHHGGHSVNTLPAPTRLQHWYGNLLKFGAKHFTPWQVRAVGGAVLAGCLLRFAAGYRGCATVVKLACTYLLYGRTVRIEGN